MISVNDLCPCQSGKTYSQCCEALHKCKKTAPTAKALMRSRYCAFVLKCYDYLITSQHPDNLNGLTQEDLAQEPLPHWLGLDVIEHNESKNSATVTFKAWYKLDNHIDAIFEQSSFIKQDDVWYYTTGEQFQTKLPKRNDPCVCKSGKKFKQCCAKN